VALLACTLTAAEALRGAGIDAPVSRTFLPWDADRQADDAPDARLLYLRPVSPFARSRDVAARSSEADGAAFRAAARGLLVWSRTQPGLLLDAGRTALARWKAQGEADDLATAQALLRAYTERTPFEIGNGVAAWVETVPEGADAWGAFHDALPRVHPLIGLALEKRFPAAAWRFLEPSARDGSLDPRHLPTVLRLATARHDAADAPLLRTLAAAPGAEADVARGLRDLADALQKGR
jgi:hypothetical protein